MCGIAGRLNFDPGQPVDPALVRAMCATLVHRGPDDEGVYVHGPVGIGMRRLSIIDLSGGRQPMANEDGTIHVVFNGEIYNYREWRPVLEARGHRFATHSDTETIVHLYEDYGADFVHHLRGMFAIALWDRSRRTLLLARDRLGIKPLYYALGRDHLLFGSELKALLAAGLPREIDPQALHEYLSFNYVPGPRTIFKAARKLQPGHRLIATGTRVWTEPYWTPLAAPSATPEAPPGPRPIAYYAEQLLDLLREAVRYRLVSDVPLGVFLSGGVDSSTIVALMREVSSAQIQTFSIGFTEESYNELPHARLVARHFETDHHEFVVTADAADTVPKMIRFFDEPFADSSALPVYHLSRLARTRVKVALGGDGGDEVFAGYHTYTACKLAAAYRRLPRPVQAVVPRLIARLPVSHAKISLDYKAKRFVQGAQLPPERAHHAWKEIFSEDMKRDLYATQPEETLVDPFHVLEAALAECGPDAVLARLQHADLRVYLPDDILVKVDRMSMAHSLEVRVPLLDHKLVEFAWTVPPELRLRGLTKKYLLKRAMAGRLPWTVLHRRKAGFNVPIPGWLRGDLSPYLRDVLSEKRLREQGFFRPEYVQRLIQDHLDLRVDYSRQLWGLLVFALWYEAYGPGSPVPDGRRAIP